MGGSGFLSVNEPQGGLFFSIGMNKSVLTKPEPSPSNVNFLSVSKEADHRETSKLEDSN